MFGCRNRHQQESETNSGGTATLNARDFSKAFRAIEKVDDSVFLGLIECQFIMFGEGDNGEVHAMPDADVTGDGSGGLYSADYLNTLRLSIDRRASTTMELALPRVGPDVDADHPHVRRAEYPIEKDHRHH